LGVTVFLLRRCFLHFYATTLETDLTIQPINDIATLTIKVWGGSIAVYSVMCDTLATVQRITVFLRQKNSIAGYDLKQYTFKVLASNILQLSSSSTIEAGISMNTQNEKAEIQLSPDYRYLAIAYQKEGTENSFVRLYENNNANFVLYGCYKVAGVNTGSLDFSPESKYLYLVSHTAANRGIIRLNVGLLPPNNTPTEVANQAIDYATTLFNLNNTGTTGVTYSSIRRAKNGNMYVAYTGSKQLFAIKNPDVANIANITTLSVQLTQTLKGGISAQPIIYYSLSKRSDNEPLFATRERGSKVYELNDHLGNVRSVVSDIKELILPDAASSGNISVTGTSAITSATTTAFVPYNPITDNDQFTANILTLNNYYPYGMLQPGRSRNAGGYRFGYQGQEADNKIGGLGEHVDFGARGLNTWTGRFYGLDRYAHKFPSESHYGMASNMPIAAIDANGDSTYLIIYGAGYLNYKELKSHNVGRGFLMNAQKLKEKMERSHGFDPNRDAVVLVYAPSTNRFVKATNKKYKSGKIASLTVFSHGYGFSETNGTETGGVSLGGEMPSETRDDGSVVTMIEAEKQRGNYDLREINGNNLYQIDTQNFDCSATLTFYGCWIGGGKNWTDEEVKTFSFAQRMADQLGLTIRAFTDSGLFKTDTNGKIVYDGTMIGASDAKSQKTRLSIFKPGQSPKIIRK
jgi:RHS repeat-associated protein